MEPTKPTVEQILKNMAASLGEEPRPMTLMSQIIPEWIPRQAQERKFVFDLPHIPAKYKHLIMVATAASTGSHKCTETYIKQATRAGATKEEIGEALLAARFALASTVFATALDGMEYLVGSEQSAQE
jgi:AhpD family alkylhydroperoxidase